MKLELPPTLDTTYMSQPKLRIGVIGISGRDSEKCVIKKEVYFRLVNHLYKNLERICSEPFIKRNVTLVTPACGFGDHMPISLYLMGKINELELVLPAPLDNGKFNEKKTLTINSIGGRWNPAALANYYHDIFSGVMGKNTRLGIQTAIDIGAKVINPKSAYTHGIFNDSKLDKLFVYSFKKPNNRLQNAMTSVERVSYSVFDVDLI